MGNARRRSLTGRVMLVLACLLMAGARLATPALAMPAMVAALEAQEGICHPASDTSPLSPDEAKHHLACQECALCQMASLPGLEPGGDILLPAPVAVLTLRTIGPEEATGPPDRQLTAFRSRAPPARSA